MHQIFAQKRSSFYPKNVAEIVISWIPWQISLYTERTTKLAVQVSKKLNQKQSEYLHSISQTMTKLAVQVSKKLNQKQSEYWPICKELLKNRTARISVSNTYSNMH